MSRKPETRLVNQIMKALKAEGGWWVKIHGSPFQASGIPDILGCYNGRFIAFEAKMPEGKLSSRQAWMMKRIAGAGGVVRTVYNPETAIGAVRRLNDR